MSMEFDAVIIGGGVSGCATFYTLSEYSSLKRVAIVEKCSKLAQISSSAKANSQTI
ncbi:FAD-dependent oxidoreductase, partial [Helicobacter pylori]